MICLIVNMHIYIFLSYHGNKPWPDIWTMIPDMIYYCSELSVCVEFVHVIKQNGETRNYISKCKRA